MNLAPKDVDDLSDCLVDAHRSRTVIQSTDLSRFDRVLAHVPEDLTATVQSGASVERFQKELGQKNQWLPVYPPNPADITIEDMIAWDLNGPHRFGFGTIRDYLIGIQVVLGDGRIVRAGGKVVKNVAGFDLCKLFVGSQGSLGVITEATVKLMPLPEVESAVVRPVASTEEAVKTINAILDSPLRPVVFDWIREAKQGSAKTMKIIMAFSGNQTDVAWQCQQAASMGFVTCPTEFAYDTTIRLPESGSDLRTVSVLPSRLGDAVNRLTEEAPFVARAGNGILYYRDIPLKERIAEPSRWMRRLKKAYDPGDVLPHYGRGRVRGETPGNCHEKLTNDTGA